MALEVWSEKREWAEAVLAEPVLDEIEKKKMAKLVDAAVGLLVEVGSLPKGSSRDQAVHHLQLCLVFGRSAIKGKGVV
jgi:hypothetical protein